MRWFLPRVTCRLRQDCDGSHSKPDVEEDGMDGDLQRGTRIEGLGRRLATDILGSFETRAVLESGDEPKTWRTRHGEGHGNIARLVAMR